MMAIYTLGRCLCLILYGGAAQGSAGVSFPVALAVLCMKADLYKSITDQLRSEPHDSGPCHLAEDVGAIFTVKLGGLIYIFVRT